MFSPEKTDFSERMGLAMAYRIDLGCWNGIFAVPNCVADEHLKLAGAASLKLLLYLLRYSGRSVSSEELTEVFHLAPADVADALSFWIERGVLTQNEDLMTPPPQKESTPAASLVFEPLTQASETETSAGQVIPKPESLVVRRPPSPTRLTGTELARKVEADPELGLLIEKTQEILDGRLLTPSDMSVIVSIHDWAGMPADVLLMLLEYMKGEGKTSLRAIETAAYRWVDAGIDSHERAEAYILEQKSLKGIEGQFASALGIGGQKLTSKQREYFRRWGIEWGFELPLVELAYERNIDNTAKLSFPYIDKILSAWYAEGYKTVSDVESNDKKPQKADSAKPSYDLDAFEESALKTPVFRKRKGGAQ